MPPIPYLAYGQVETSDGQPAVGTLVRVWLLEAQHALSGAEGDKSPEPLSTLVDGHGYWSLNLSSDMDLPAAKCEDLQLKLGAFGRRGSEAELIQPSCKVQPVAVLVLQE